APDDDEVGIMWIDRDRPDGKVFETGVAAAPRFPGVVRYRDHSPAPQPPARRPQPPIAIDHQAVDDVAGKRHAVARVLPRLAGVVRDVHLAAAGAEEESVRIGGIDDQGA